MAGGCDIGNLVAPIALSSTVGTNIASAQPDVEVLAVVLKRFPLSKEAFAETSGSNDWVSLPVSIVSIGPPGFSRVPYNSNKKKGEKDAETVQKLYESRPDADFAVTFHSYMKGKTNKDRGNRVSEFVPDDGTDKSIACNATIEPGMCLSAFVREEHYQKNTFFLNREALNEEGGSSVQYLPKFSFVYLQIGSQNIEQAKKGSLVKIKKMKLVNDYTSIDASILKHFPDSPANYDQINNKAKAQDAICNQVYKGYYSLFKLVPVPEAYVSYNEEKQEFICVDVDCPGGKEVVVPRFTMLRACGTTDNSRAVRIATIAIAMGSMTLMVAHSESDGVVMGGQDSPKYMGTMAVIDPNILLSLPELSQCPYDSMTYYTTDNLDVARGSRTITWSWKDKLIKTEKCISGQRMVFSLSLQRVEAIVDSFNPDVNPPYLADGCEGDFHRLSVYFVSPNIPWDKVLTFDKSIVDPIITLQVRPENAKTARVVKRPHFRLQDAKDDWGENDDFAPPLKSQKGEVGRNPECEEEELEDDEE